MLELRRGNLTQTILSGLRYKSEVLITVKELKTYYSMVNLFKLKKLKIVLSCHSKQITVKISSVLSVLCILDLCFGKI